MDLAPHHVGIIVGDLERSKAFYAALGFEPGVERVSEDKTISFMSLGPLHVELFAYREPVLARASEVRTTGFRHLAFETVDIDGTLADLKAAGVIPLDARTLDLPDGWRLYFFHDPDGVEIEIKQA